MMELNYLQTLLQTDKFKNHPEYESFFKNYQKKIHILNTENLSSFLVSQSLSYESKNDLTAKLNQKIFKIEKDIQNTLAIKDFSTAVSFQKIFCFALKYIPPFEGLFLKSESAKKIIGKIPLVKTLKELGKSKYECHNPLLLLSIGRYSEGTEWNQKYINELSNLTIQDFESRTPQLYIINHNQFKLASSSIIKNKCFNTHDKLTGAHIISTLPESFDLNNKAPVLRTVTKMIHYHKEMAIFCKAFKQMQNINQGSFGGILSQVFKQHYLNSNAPLFNTFEIIEGLANREINTRLHSMVLEFPKLEPWSLVHNVAHIIKDEFLSLSLWRLTAWYLNGKREHTIKMYKDDILAGMLIQIFDEDLVEQAVINSITGLKDDVLAECKNLKTTLSSAA